ncbi:MAG: sigma-70 RNA polymerase sigma factor region 4 domain-containing protein [Solirubrobacteraceae bacterium]
MEKALARALPLGGEEGDAADVADARADTERTVAARLDLRALFALARRLSDDQRLVLVCRVGLDMSPAEFCRRFGWSLEKFRKVDQRGRAKLRVASESVRS